MGGELPCAVIIHDCHERQWRGSPVGPARRAIELNFTYIRLQVDIVL
jgi:hypothetical protein